MQKNSSYVQDAKASRVDHDRVRLRIGRDMHAQVKSVTL